MTGPLTIERHHKLQSEGHDLHVFVNGVDVTHRCQFADDTPGWEIAVLYRHRDGHAYLDLETRKAAVEIVRTRIEIRGVVNEAVSNE